MKLNVRYICESSVNRNRELQLRRKPLWARYKEKANKLPCWQYALPKSQALRLSLNSLEDMFNYDKFHGLVITSMHVLNK